MTGRTQQPLAKPVSATATATEYLVKSSDVIISGLEGVEDQYLPHERRSSWPALYL
jgi:hypothetical protein